MLFFLPFNRSILTPFCGTLTPFRRHCVFSSEGHSVQNIVWPPIQDEEPELPTASPLYFPPPSLLHVHPKEFVEKREEADDCQPWNEDEINRIMAQEPKMSICSAEVTSITDRRSAVECVETISETLDTQLLVESILQKRPRSPPPVDRDVSVEATIRIPESDIRGSTKLTQTTVEVKKKDTGEFKRPTDFSPNTLEYEKKPPSPKIVNAIPKKWESQLLNALTTIPDGSSSEDPFSQIPAKRPSSTLASALTVAPAAPFTPAPPSTAEPVPLPEYTEPYLPPERPIIPLKQEEKTEPFKEQPPPPYSPFVKALQIAPERPYTPVPEKPGRKKKLKEDPLFKELPKPERELTMREALAVAPDIPCAPLISEITVKFDNGKSIGMERQEIRIEQEHTELQRPLKPAVLPASFQVPLATPPKPFVSSFPPISDELKIEVNNKKDVSEQSCLSAKCETVTKQSDETIEKDTKTTVQEQTTQKTFIQETIEKQSEDTIYKKPLPLASSLRPADALPQYQVNLSENVEMELLMLEKQEMYNKSAEFSSVTNTQTACQQQQTQKKPIVTVQIDSQGAPKKPIIMVQPEDNQQLSQKSSFQPVVEDRPPSVSFSPRPRPLTPSMINKPAPTIPYYQANLVAQQYPAPGTNLFDPMSPAISRSPSPCPEARNSSPFRPPSAARPKSPAPGPPPNPLKSKEPLPTPQSSKVAEAKRSLSAYIPQYREKMDLIEKARNTELQKQLRVCEKERRSDELQKQVQVPQSTPVKSIQQSVNQGKTCVVCPAQQECYREEVIQKTKDGEERRLQAFSSSSASTQHEYKTADATTCVTQQQKQQHLEQSSKSESRSVQQLNEGKIQVERKKTVTEEFEHCQKSKVVQIERNAAAKHPFRDVNVSAIEEQQGIVGMHVTNPQPIVSRFISAEKNQQTVAATLSQAQSQSKPQPQALLPQAKPAALCPSASSIPASKATPSSTHCVGKSIVPIPHSGVGGGRQAGAIGVAPKRGRGVLNTAALGGGSRIPLCGHCHSYIRYYWVLLLRLCFLAANNGLTFFVSFDFYFCTNF